MLLPVLPVGLSLLLLALAQQDAPAPAPAPAPPAETIRPEPAEGDAKSQTEAERVGAFLAELEKTGTTIATLSGGLALEKYDAFLEETERRFGRVVVELPKSATGGTDDGARRFAIYFDEVIDGSGRSDRSITHWIYADGWLCEQDHANRSFTKRQIVAPGEKRDPLALGDGPIPLPIGQRKDDVLAQFDVTETEPPLDIPLLGSLRNVAGLRLVPKEGTAMAKDTAAIELFYDRTSLAPTGVVIRARNGNRTVARINRPVVNGEVSEADRALLVIPSPDPKEWAIDVRPWRKAE